MIHSTLFFMETERAANMSRIFYWACLAVIWPGVFCVITVWFSIGNTKSGICAVVTTARESNMKSTA